MCLEDVTINRAIKTRVYGTGSSVVIPANTSRLAIRLCPTDVDTAELWAQSQPTIGGVGSASVLLGFATRHHQAISGDLDVATPFDDVTLEKVGEILRSEVVLVSVNSLRVWAIETYLEIVTPVSLDVSKLG